MVVTVYTLLSAFLGATCLFLLIVCCYCLFWDTEALEPEIEKEGGSLSNSAPDSELAKEAKLSRSVPDTESLVLDEILLTNTVISSSDEVIASSGQQKEVSWINILF